MPHDSSESWGQSKCFNNLRADVCRFKPTLYNHVIFESLLSETEISHPIEGLRLFPYYVHGSVQHTLVCHCLDTARAILGGYLALFWANQAELRLSFVSISVARV